MSMSFKLEIKDSFLKKTNPLTYITVMDETVKKTTFEAERRCKKEAPFLTGALRRGHSSDFKEHQGEVKNIMSYWVYVVYGHGTYAGDNYPMRVINSLISENYMSNIFNKELKKLRVN